MGWLDKLTGKDNNKGGETVPKINKNTPILEPDNYGKLFYTNGWIHNKNKNVIDLEEMVARRMVRLITGNGFKLWLTEEQKEDSIEKGNQTHKISMLKLKFELENVIGVVEKLLSKHGTAFLAIDLAYDNKTPHIVVADPNLLSQVGRSYANNVIAIIWTKFWVDDKLYFLRKTYDKDSITTDAFQSENEKGEEHTSKDKSVDSTVQHGKEITIQGISAETPDEIRVKIGTIKHNFGVVPVIQFMNIPDETFIFDRIGNCSDLRNVPHIQSIINHLIVIYKKESIINKTKIFGVLSTKNMAADTSVVQKDIFLANQELSAAGNAQGIDIMQATPILSQYTDAINQWIKMAYLSAGLDYGNDKQVSNESATGAMLGESQDMSLVNEKRTLRQQQYTQLISKFLVMLKIQPNEWEKKFVFELKTNVSVDTFQKAKETETLIQNGIITHVEGISRANGNIPLNEARNIRDKIIAEKIEEAKIYKEAGFPELGTATANLKKEDKSIETNKDEKPKITDNKQPKNEK
jgi:hypothetical protein